VVYLQEQLAAEPIDNPNVLGVIHQNSAPITEELIAAAIAGVVNSARAQGQSLDELTGLVLAEDQDLDLGTRRWLSEVVAEAWRDLSEAATLETV
jgi:hypothetical protein